MLDKICQASPALRFCALPMAVDMRTGNIWGFPTYTQDAYPSPSSNTSHPFLLGKSALANVDK